MKQKAILFLALGISLALALGLAAGLALARDDASIAAATAPTVVSYQGEVLVDGEPYNGAGYFKFAVVNTAGTSTYWSNDDTSANGSEPTSAEELSVEDGLFAILLGNSAAPYNMPPINASVFADKGRRLHVWFDADGEGTFTDLDLTVVAAVPYALNAETLDGKDGSYYDHRYEHVRVVAKSGGDYTTVVDALDDISDNGPESRYLVWVGPGTYTETVTMKEYVDIEGAGELLTTISYTGSDHSFTGTVVGEDNAELRFLTVRNTGGDAYAIGIYNFYVSPRLTHVTISASGGTNTSYGVFNDHSSPAMVNVRVTASASGEGWSRGVVNGGSSAPTMTDVTVSASSEEDSIGVLNTTSTPTMTNVTAAAFGEGTNKGVYNYASSPTMVDVTASASGGTNGFGVDNFDSSPTMTRVIASSSGASNANSGVYNNSSSATMVEVIASASGGTSNNGVSNYSSSLTIRNSTITASGTGLYNRASSDSYIVTVDNCQITGDTYSLDNDNSNNYTTYVGASLLDGAVTGAGTETCVFSYDESYTELDNVCQ